ncbi:hypothetical protein [Pseudoxanthomonas winnipegensis]|nr:hypothetical protein [Pseudoxanthomonas winnipegensis]
MPLHSQHDIPAGDGVIDAEAFHPAGGGLFARLHAHNFELPGVEVA